MAAGYAEAAMVRPSLLVVVLPLMLATLLVTANAQIYTAPVPSPLPDAADSPSSLSSSSPPPPSSSSAPPPYSSTPPPPPPASSWTPVVNVNDPSIVQVAKFAVHIYGLSMTTEVHMQLLSVVSGEIQRLSDGGCNYRLTITVSGGQNTQYEAFVWGILGTSSWKLWSFTPV